jgi:cytochrome b561
MMQIGNTIKCFGFVSILTHWVSAIAIIGLFALGLWMTGLDYYDTWYQQSLDLHQSIGVLLILVFVLRILWRWLQPLPEPEPGTRPLEHSAALWAHRSMYFLTFLIGLSGYLISTADGRAVEVFNWFSIPATIQDLEQQEDMAGEVHEILVWLLIIVSSVHSLAALKHHFLDRDKTLLNMLGKGSSTPR